jgi:hypothetical protein
MAYNNPTPAQSTTLTAEERAKEARKILEMLHEEDQDEVERKLTGRALEFVQGKWLEMDLGGQVNVTPNQYWWLQDIWSKFA